jgi:hypothetical protein
MGFQLPKALQMPESKDSLRYLRLYYQERPETPLGTSYTDARFDDWGSADTRGVDVNRFASDDLVAVTFLSVGSMRYSDGPFADLEEATPSLSCREPRR